MESLFAAGALVLLIFLGIIIKNRFSGNAGKDAPAPDPLAEADVYLAYGKREKAIQVLESALEADDTREDIRQKLKSLKAP